jgi:hypothetical protein
MVNKARTPSLPPQGASAPRSLHFRSLFAAFAPVTGGPLYRLDVLRLRYFLGRRTAVFAFRVASLLPALSLLVASSGPTLPRYFAGF